MTKKYILNFARYSVLIERLTFINQNIPTLFLSTIRFTSKLLSLSQSKPLKERLHLSGVFPDFCMFHIVS